MRGPVSLDEVGMVDGDERRLLVEAVDRIATLAHHLVEQRLGVAERVLGCVDEMGLGVVPLLGVLLSRRRSERLDVELVAGLGARREIVRRAASLLSTVGSAHRPVPLRSEALLETL